MRTTITALLALVALTFPAVAAANAPHTVRRGESLSSIAAADGLSIDALAAANGLSAAAQLTAGTVIQIPPRGVVETATGVPSTTATTAADYATTAAPSGDGAYLVRPGDTLSAIAARYGTTVQALAAANGMSPNGILYSGRSISVDGAAAVPTAAPAPTEVTHSTGAQPTQEFVSSGEVGSVAEADGVPAALAEALADQESGFNNDEVSSTGATGVMQIEPGTWRDLTAADPGLSANSAYDNVRGGVELLHSLLDQTGGDTTEAVAAYYQGLESVREHGMFAGTRHYVRNVLALEARFGG